MIRDRDILLIVLLLGGVAGGLFYLAAWLSLPTEVRQALMLVVGMLLMAALSALSTYLGSTPFLQATAIPTTSAISLDKNHSNSAKENKISPSQSSSNLDIIINEIFDQMLLLARQADVKGATDHPSFIAVATNLRYSEIIDDDLFRGLIFFKDTCNNFSNALHTEKDLINVTINIGSELLHQLRELNTTNEYTQEQIRHRS